MDLLPVAEMGGKRNGKTLMLEIKKIKRNELESFTGSDFFNRLPVVPITPERAKSYVRNPRSQPGDVVLYLGFIDEQLVAFRSLFADWIFEAGQPVRFGWFSGNWVHPQFRRQGFSEALLREAYSDWNGKLMFTNYAPESEKLYLKTGWFKPIHQFSGVRGYLFPKTRKLLPAANRNILLKSVFTVADSIIVLVSSFRILFFRDRVSSEFSFETLPTPDEACFNLLRRSEQNFLFNRGEAELQWIFRFPWIMTTSQIRKISYPFSSVSSSFYYQTVKLFKRNELAGFFIFSVREGHLKTLFFCLPENAENAVALFLKKYCVLKKIEVITLYNQQVSEWFFAQKFPFLRLKKFGQKIYSTFLPEHAETYRFQDGDGDVFFT